MGEKHDAAGQLRLKRLRCILELCRLPYIPVVVVEDVFAQLSRRLQESVRLQHRVDVIEDLPYLPGTIDRVEPNRLAIKHQAGDVGENARAQASTLGKVNRIAYLAPRPLLLVDIHRHCGIPAIRAATAAAGEAIRKMRPVLHDVERAAVGANHALAMRGHISSTGIR